MHKCAAHTCKVQIEDNKLFCEEDWYALPDFIKEGVFEGIFEKDTNKIRYFKKQGIAFLRETQGK